MTSESGLRGHRVQNPAKAQARRRDILLAAASVIAREGYANASLDTIAARIGVTKGVIYYYFRSKEEILTEIRTTAIHAATERLEATIARGGTPDVMLQRAVEELVRHIFDDIDRYAVVLRAGEVLGPESYEKVRTLQRHFERLLTGIVESGVRAGLFFDHNPRITTFTILRACLGVADWYAPEGRLTPAEIVPQVTRQVLAGVLTSAVLNRVFNSPPGTRGDEPATADS